MESNFEIVTFRGGDIPAVLLQLYILYIVIHTVWQSKFTKDVITQLNSLFTMSSFCFCFFVYVELSQIRETRISFVALLCVLLSFPRLPAVERLAADGATSLTDTWCVSQIHGVYHRYTVCITDTRCVSPIHAVQDTAMPYSLAEPAPY